ncbi:aspartyl/asparaginyl beta-hydroxylase domain-containing protein [Candidatus Methylobacter oryzae]|uniref:Aspartyl/asparaginyl beta-hydroxylase domain-containing protein n=1 Tax=Candidatus Methylobacter oryzae TaxID=2497749 RepID=A0ABY3C5T5_9GAMM|nr:aspartyl/asparaginyl beta-hydroxylase domain-containing protein [Candidatus Methylobacter oryzae]TRW90369.1 aspartyl/asparaginyl beta-hydroxylase domain-containing protein [Candidatus Methylobacter oryzae]
MVPDDCGTREGQLQKDIVHIMRQGGYWDAIMDGDSSLDRVKVFLRTLAGEIPAIVNDMQRPNVLPIFPGLNYKPVHDKADYPWAAQLESAFSAIRDEIMSLSSDCDFLGYEGGLAQQNMWSVVPMYYMGTPIRDFQKHCPKTVEIVNTLSGHCFEYPWGDCLFSRQAAGSHLIAHCSIDAFRLRAHLGLDVPGDCTMRVKDNLLHWRNGEVFIFEDSFEHEVWNRSDKPRTVLIIDFWHPDLTDVEKQALMAGFRKYEMRAMMCKFRLGDHRERFEPLLLAQFKEEDQHLDVARYWPEADCLKMEHG